MAILLFCRYIVEIVYYLYNKIYKVQLEVHFIMGTGVTKRYIFNSAEKSDINTLLADDIPNIMDVELRIAIRNKTESYSLDKDEILKTVTKMIGYNFDIDKYNRDNFGERSISVKDRDHPDIKELNGWCTSKLARGLGSNFKKYKWFFYGSENLQKYWCDPNADLDDIMTVLFLYICLLMEPYMSVRCKEYFDYLEMNKRRLTFNLVVSMYNALAYNPHTASYGFDAQVIGPVQMSLTTEEREAERKRKIEEKERAERERRKKAEEDEKRYREYKERERQRIEEEKRQKDEEKRKKDRELAKIAKKLKYSNIKEFIDECITDAMDDINWKNRVYMSTEKDIKNAIQNCAKENDASTIICVKYAVSRLDIKNPYSKGRYRMLRGFETDVHDFDENEILGRIAKAFTQKGMKDKCRIMILQFIHDLHLKFFDKNYRYKAYNKASKENDAKKLDEAKKKLDQYIASLNEDQFN